MKRAVEESAAAPIFLARHGETEWNAAGRLQGRSDSPLTERGAGQALRLGALLAERLRGRPVRIVVSPLGRARQTAKRFASALGVGREAIEVEERIAECGFGAWEGCDRREIERRWPGEWARREATKWSYRPPGGESYESLCERVLPWLDELGELDGERAVVVVTHEMVSRVVRMAWLGLPADEALSLDHLQDRIYRFERGRLTTLTCAAGPIGA